MVIIFCTIVVLDADICRCGTKYSTGFLCNYANTGVDSCLNFHTCTNYRSFRCQKRHGLTLHVGSHQRTVSIVVLQERNQGCSNGEYHTRRYVHVIKHMTLILLSLFTETTGYILMNEVSFFVQRLIRLCYMVIILFICGHIYNLICYTRILRICFVDLTVRCLDKSVLIDSRIGCKRVDQTDVRTFRGLNRAHSSVM